MADFQLRSPALTFQNSDPASGTTSIRELRFAHSGVQGDDVQAASPQRLFTDVVDASSDLCVKCVLGGFGIVSVALEGIKRCHRNEVSYHQ
jgi:hypothetical protein